MLNLYMFYILGIMKCANFFGFIQDYVVFCWCSDLLEWAASASLMQ